MTATRRVVVGPGPDGRSTIVEGAGVEAVRVAGSGALVTLLAGVDHRASSRAAAAEPPSTVFPAPEGWRMVLMSFPPSSAPRPGPGEGAVFPDLVAAMRAGGGNGMHATETVDAVLVTGGRIVLEAADGSAVELVAGDVVVQLAAMHRWRNESTAAATLAVFMVGAPG